jgi:hypothetical protein
MNYNTLLGDKCPFVSCGFHSPQGNKVELKAGCALHSFWTQKRKIQGPKAVFDAERKIKRPKAVLYVKIINPNWICNP